MKPELSHDELRYLASLVRGEFRADFWNDNGRQELATKLDKIRDQQK